MIAVGIDGLSRGDRSTGVMSGVDMKMYVPLHLSAVEQSPSVLTWIKDITRDLGPTFLTPEGWFVDTHTYGFRGSFIWMPPPAAADVVVEQLARARHKRPDCLHLIVVPRLMTGYWRKHLTRGSDCHFLVDSPDIWDLDEQYEPLLVFLCLPFISREPNLNGRKEYLEQFQREVCTPEMSQLGSPGSRRLLRKFLNKARYLSDV